MELAEYFARVPKAAVAFSGGVDSAYLLCAAAQCGANVHAYYVKSAFQPNFELEDARRLAAQLAVPLTVLQVDVLSDPVICANPQDRCYHCKSKIFSAIIHAAQTDGYPILLDGTNASDAVCDRPGMRALQELAVQSPLRICNLDKTTIRALSKKAGLFTWDKPAYACLATRIPAGEAITAKKLERTERAEAYLSALGFSNFRVRMEGTSAKLQLPQAQLERLLQNRAAIIQELKKDYTAVLLDLEVRDE